MRPRRTVPRTLPGARIVRSGNRAGSMKLSAYNFVDHGEITLEFTTGGPERYSSFRISVNGSGYESLLRAMFHANRKETLDALAAIIDEALTHD